MTYGEYLYKVAEESNKKIQQNISEHIQQLTDPNGILINELKKKIDMESKKGGYKTSFMYSEWFKKTNMKLNTPHGYKYITTCKMIADKIGKELDISIECNLGGTYGTSFFLYMDWNKNTDNTEQY